MLDDAASVLAAAEQGLGLALARWSLVAGDHGARECDDRQQTALAGPAADRLDEALREIAQSSCYGIVRQNVEDVSDREEARKRMAAGTYGVCTDCGREIGYQRLLAYPTAKRCINCQMEVERKRAASQGRSAS